MKYLDDNHVLLGERDITNFVSDASLDDSIDAIAVVFTFTVFISEWDRYVPKLNIATGDKVKLMNGSSELFFGIVRTAGLDGQITAYDHGYYLNKSEITFQCSSERADDAIRQLCGKAGVKAGTIPEMPTVIDDLWVGDTAAAVLNEILETCTAKTGKQYHYRVYSGKLCISELTREPLTAYHKPAENIAAFDITWALGQVSGEDSSDGLYNSVVIAAEEDGNIYIGASASNEESKLKHGALQRVETVTYNPGNEQLEAMAKNLLQQYDRVSHTRRIEEIWGADEVKSGVVLSFNSPAFGISGLHRVTHVVHHYGGAGHTMELELQALEQPRASQDAAWMKGERLPPVEDKVQVYGLPESLGAEAELASEKATAEEGEMVLVGGQTVKALFTAYYPANDAMEGGFKDAMGNWLNPANNTCAAPRSIPFGTKITVQGTGTSRDGQTYTVTDRGGAITVVNGVYHFDILMSTKVECNNWGKRYGTAVIGGEWQKVAPAASSGAAAFVEIAAGEVGYKESKKDMTKYGEWFGTNGVAWCAIFVCWCASKAGAPIPTNYAAVSQMADYFKNKGLYKSVASGYTPQPGDLMIQGTRHIGIVESADRSGVKTIEGNCSNSVKRMTRSYSEITGFCTPWKVA